MRNLHLILLVGIIIPSLGRDYPSFYHSTASLNEELEYITAECSNLIQMGNASTEPLIKEVNINQGQGKKMKAYLLFGEHPRELISPESGLQFVKDLCSKLPSEQNQRILDNYEIRMILNANPLSRQKVETGDYCLRENEHGVDLNRNYDAHWEQIKDDQRQITSGNSPFSEPETQAIRDSLKNFGADLFLSVHSGTLGMYTPHAYSEADGEVNEGNMIDVLDSLQDKYCPSCDVGAAGREVGYLSPGSCIDYAYDALNIKYAFAFEIFHQDIDLEQEVEENDRNFVSFLQIQETTQERKLRNQKKQKNAKHRDGESCFLQMESKAKQMDNDSCFHYFNPESQDDYNWYVSNWSNAMSDMLTLVLDKEGDSTETQKLNIYQGV